MVFSRAQLGKEATSLELPWFPHFYGHPYNLLSLGISPHGCGEEPFCLVSLPYLSCSFPSHVPLDWKQPDSYVL